MSTSPRLTATGGDEQGGFEARLDAADRVLHVRLWGVWSVPTATAFCTAIVQLGQRVAGAPWSVVANSRDFRPQAPEIARLRQEAMIDLQELGCDKIASFGQNVVHAMQFKRITAESDMSSATFSEEGAALHWVHERRSPGT